MCTAIVGARMFSCGNEESGEEKRTFCIRLSRLHGSSNLEITTAIIILWGKVSAWWKGEEIRLRLTAEIMLVEKKKIHQEGCNAVECDITYLSSNLSKCPQPATSSSLAHFLIKHWKSVKWNYLIFLDPTFGSKYKRINSLLFLPSFLCNRFSNWKKTLQNLCWIIIV